jgi:hypothetical protein
MTMITVTGAGGCIQNEMFLIADALRKAGFVVDIADPYYPDEKYDDPAKIEQTRQHCTNFNSGALLKGTELGELLKCPTMRVQLKANHLPWGG